ncbi:MAG: hypothetical protein J2P17_15600, partial [Mycobacterium sp.]|nr:hypothetical protein [Mycobacterium sp.]
VSATAQTITQRRQKPFGDPRGTVPTWVNPHGFVGGLADPDGLTHLGAREYDPTTGRFLSSDPILDSSNPQQMAAYSYAGNTPVTASDPSGQMYANPANDSVGCGSCSTPSTNTNPTSHPSPTNHAPPQNCSGWGFFNCAANSVGNLFSAAGNFVQQHKAIIATVVSTGISLASGPACGAAAAAIPIVGGAACEMFLGGVSNLASDWINGDIHDWGDAFKSFGVGAVTGLLGFGVGKLLGTGFKAGKIIGKTAKEVGEGAETAAEAGEKNAAKAIDCVANSFVPETAVLMANGTRRRIDQVKPGDKVMAGDPATGTEHAEKVTATIVGTGDKNLVDLTVRAGNGHGWHLTATDRHPFWVESRHQWMDAGRLQPGDQVLTATGERLAVLSVRHYTAYQRVVNLSVQDLHTYYVLAGTTPVLVHNCGEVAVDTNVVSDALSGGRAADVDAALRGRSPVLSPTAYNELLDRHSAEDVANWLAGRGGRMGPAATPSGIQAIQDSLRRMWRTGFQPMIHDADAAVLDSARQEGLPLLTNDGPFARNAGRLGDVIEGY